MRNVNFVDNLKLRAGWGQTGNAGGLAGMAVIAQSTDAAYKTYPLNGSSGAWGNGVRDIGFFMPLKDADLKWETTEMLNFGIDFAFLQNWDITVDYFIKKTKDLLLYRQMRPSAGYTEVYTNYGEIENKGFEFALGYHKQFNKDFSFNARLTGSTLKNKVKKMGDPLYNTCSDNNGASRYDGSQVGAIDGNGYWNNHSICMEGEAVGSYYGYVVKGIIQNEQQLKEYTDYLTKDWQDAQGNWHTAGGDAESKCDQDHPLAVGDMMFEDLNGDHTIDQNDRKILGNALASLQYGFTLSFDYMGFDVQAFFQGTGDHYWYPAGMNLMFWGPYSYPYTSFLQRDFIDRVWSVENPNTYFPRPRAYSSTGGELSKVNSRYLQNIRYLRFKNLTVGYSLPGKVTRKIGIDKVRVYFSGENLAYWSPLKKNTLYLDPESAYTRSGTGNSAAQDHMSYPWQKTFMFGVEITF